MRSSSRARAIAPARVQSSRYRGAGSRATQCSRRGLGREIEGTVWADPGFGDSVDRADLALAARARCDQPCTRSWACVRYRQPPDHAPVPTVARAQHRRRGNGSRLRLRFRYIGDRCTKARRAPRRRRGHRSRRRSDGPGQCPPQRRCRRISRRLRAAYVHRRSRDRQYPRQSVEAARSDTRITMQARRTDCALGNSAGPGKECRELLLTLDRVRATRRDGGLGVPLGGKAVSMVTRCPACATAFRVTEPQLRARAGQVRCGRCGALFDALAALSPDPASRPPREDAEGPPISVILAVLLATERDVSFDFGPQSRPRPSRLWWGASVFLLLALAAQGGYHYRGQHAVLPPHATNLAPHICAAP